MDVGHDTRKRDASCRGERDCEYHPVYFLRNYSHMPLQCRVMPAFFGARTALSLVWTHLKNLVTVRSTEVHHEWSPGREVIA